MEWMEGLWLGFGFGMVIGCFICMFKVFKLQNELAEMRMNALRKSNKEALLKKLRKGGDHREIKPL